LVFNGIYLSNYKAIYSAEYLGFSPNIAANYAFYNQTN